MIFVFPVRLTPMRTSLSLSRTAHFGAANSTRAGWTLPAVKNRNTTFTHPFDCISGSSFLLLSVSKRTKRLLVFMRLFSSIPKALKSESELRDLLVLRAQCRPICVIRILLRSIGVIDQAWDQDGWILAIVPFLRVYGPKRSWSPWNYQKIERSQYPAILIEQSWSIKDLWRGFRESFSCGTQRGVLKGPDSTTLPAQVANHCERSGSSNACSRS